MTPCARAAWADLIAAPLTLGPTPGVREAWRRGRGRYTVWVLRVPQVAARVAEVGVAVAPWVHPVEPADAHVTLWAAGFPAQAVRWSDDVVPDTLRAQARALADRGQPQRLRVGGVSAFRSAVFLSVEVSPALRDLLAALGGSDFRTTTWCPHVTVGVFHADHSTRRVAEALAPWRHLPAVDVLVDEVHRVDFDARVPCASLRTREVVPLVAG